MLIEYGYNPTSKQPLDNNDPIKQKEGMEHRPTFVYLTLGQRRTCKQTNERTNERKNERKNERANKRTNERTNERTNKRTNERTNEWENER